jgi:hypothetical protein
MLWVMRSCPSGAAVTATVLGLYSLTLGGCSRGPETSPADKPAAAPTHIEVPSPPLLPPPLGRAALLQAIASARSAFAAGQADTAPGLTGRRFAIRQAFGCQGTSGSDASAGGGAIPGVARWTWGRKQQTIEISLTPADWTTAPALTAEGSAWEAVEGYWLTRPWLWTEGCPTGAASPENADGTSRPSPESASGGAALVSGLAAVFAPESSRLGRRDGKAFALTLRGDASLEPPANGYRLVIEGRFAAFPEGRAIRCHASSVDQAPVCVAAAEIDRVAFEDSDGKLLKEWRPG